VAGGTERGAGTPTGFARGRLDSASWSAWCRNVRLSRHIGAALRQLEWWRAGIPAVWLLQDARQW